MEIDSCTAVSWYLTTSQGHWISSNFISKEIRMLSSHLHMVFCHEIKSANRMVDALAKQGVDRVSLWMAFIIELFFGFGLMLLLPHNLYWWSLYCLCHLFINNLYLLLINRRKKKKKGCLLLKLANTMIEIGLYPKFSKQCLMHLEEENCHLGSI